jgi:diacylglycerol kinase (ATP)
VSRSTLVIVNPQSRGGATGREWPALEGRLRAALGELEIVHTKAPRDAEEIAAEAQRRGVARLLVAGGDGTVSEVVSGVLSERAQGTSSGSRPETLPERGPQIGWLPLGTGGDLARMLDLEGGVPAALERLTVGATRRVDAGRIRYLARDGSRPTKYFLNIASFGISGLVDEYVREAPRGLGGSFAFLIASLRAFTHYDPVSVRISVDGELTFEGPVSLVALANGPCFGGGMRVAPGASPDDGALEVVIIGGMSKLALLANLPSVYRGKHLAHPKVCHFRGAQIEADARPGEVWLDIDGEPLGSLPASIEVLPSAITLFGV